MTKGGVNAGLDNKDCTMAQGQQNVAWDSWSKCHLPASRVLHHKSLSFAGVFMLGFVCTHPYL